MVTILISIVKIIIAKITILMLVTIILIVWQWKACMAELTSSYKAMASTSEQGEPLLSQLPLELI